MKIDFYGTQPSLRQVNEIFDSLPNHNSLNVNPIVKEKQLTLQRF